jgi:pimeloyl-ACP methyl ester carboxylesterase
MATATHAATQPSGTYADVNGLHLYYETEGTGRPLILIHGGLGSGEMFGPVRAALRGTPTQKDLDPHPVLAAYGKPSSCRARLARSISIRSWVDERRPG